jgi:signal transduction histidine kinase
LEVSVQEVPIALVGAGHGGKAILQILLETPGITAKYVYDLDSDAPGMQLAREHGIATHVDAKFQQIQQDQSLRLILDVTGQEAVFAQLKKLKPDSCNLVGPLATRVIFELLEQKTAIMDKLLQHQQNLEVNIVKRTGECEQANRNLIDKIQEYEILNEKLQQINNEKTRYLLQATHQLKAPFAAIQSYVDIMMQGFTGPIPEQTMAIMEKVKVRCDLLQRSIKEMLKLANLKSCIEENVKMAPANISTIMGQVIHEHEVIALNKGIHLLMDKPESEPEVVCSEEQISILFAIIVENAINYSHPDSEINISISPSTHDALFVSVQDHGIGIDPKHHTRIFEEYFRSNNAVAQHENGTGLGMSIAKEIVHLHNFSLSVKSHVGEGSTFTISMPTND